MPNVPLPAGRRAAAPARAAKAASAEAKAPRVKETRSIPQLLQALEASADPIEKRNLRASLRRLGHTGGLNRPKEAPTPKPKKAAPVATPAPGRRAARAVA